MARIHYGKIEFENLKYLLIGKSQMSHSLKSKYYYVDKKKNNNYKEKQNHKQNHLSKSEGDARKSTNAKNPHLARYRKDVKIVKEAEAKFQFECHILYKVCDYGSRNNFVATTLLMFGIPLMWFDSLTPYLRMCDMIVIIDLMRQFVYWQIESAAKIYITTYLRTFMNTNNDNSEGNNMNANNDINNCIFAEDFRRFIAMPHDERQNIIKNLSNQISFLDFSVQWKIINYINNQIRHNGVLAQGAPEEKSLENDIVKTNDNAAMVNFIVGDDTAAADLKATSQEFVPLAVMISKHHIKKHTNNIMLPNGNNIQTNNTESILDKLDKLDKFNSDNSPKSTRKNNQFYISGSPNSSPSRDGEVKKPWLTDIQKRKLREREMRQQQQYLQYQQYLSNDS